jgi:hypothetical protein
MIIHEVILTLHSNTFIKILNGDKVRMVFICLVLCCNSIFGIGIITLY